MNGPFRKTAEDLFRKDFEARSKRHRGRAAEVQARVARRIGYMSNKAGKERLLIERKFQTLKMLVEIERTGKNPDSGKPLGWPAKLKNMGRAIRMYEEVCQAIDKQKEAIRGIERLGQTIFTGFKPTARPKTKEFILEIWLHEIYKSLEHLEYAISSLYFIPESIEEFRKKTR